ncbi:MAG: lipopolysaccharide transport system ATP-binding protein [Pyrinomonadaceae bacterium]|nr:lipopolysaccharide transport system ATP-binding protein [Pyrinomonadaceae bacterium]
MNDVSFDVKRGEVVGIIGRNGAGKSTLLKILSRITKPTKGHAKIHGRVGSLLEVGTGFHPELTGRENIYLNAAILGMRKAEVAKKFDEIVAFAEVEKFIDTPVKRYSSGMYVRLAFAVAAHLEPEILVIDEVLAVGDAAFQKKCLGKIGEVAHGGRTVLFVSHNMGAIRSLCTEVIWLDEGKMVIEGRASDVVDQYLRTTLLGSGSSVDLSNVQRSLGNGERLRLLNIEFNSGRPIHHGEPLAVRINFETMVDVPNVAFGFGFSTFEGVRVMTIDSDLVEAQRALPKGHVGSVRADVSLLQLQPGRYALDVGARAGDHGSLDYVAGCAQLEVLPGPTTPSSIIRDTGGVRVPANWAWSETPAFA